MQSISISKRIETIDLLKGLVMVLMALDHIRDYFHFDAYLYNPVDPTQSNLAVFFTRWITHFCAPTFFFLAGISAFMSGQKKSTAQLSAFLLTRGIWLVFLELTVVMFGWQFDPYFRINGFAVIAALGFSMIALAGLIHLQRNLLLVLSCLLIFGHNLLDPIKMPGNFAWALFHQAQVFNISENFKFYLDYPLIPWIPVMSLGYCFGQYYTKSYAPVKRRKLFTTLGFSAIALFLLLRTFNVYGEPALRLQYDSAARDLMSFLNLTKYPPSLQYLLVTLGSVLIFLGNSEQLTGKVVRFFTMFGRVPFFYYLLHLYLVHALAALIAKLAGYGWKLLVLPDWILEMPSMKGYGYSLGVVYLVWVLVIALAYPVCRWYDRYKMNHKNNWMLSYL